MSSSFENISVASMVTWRSSFRHYQGVVLSIDYEDTTSSDNCEVFIVYEVDDREVYTLLRRSYRISPVRPAVKEYLDIVMQNYIDSHQDIDITPMVKYTVLRDAIDRIDERNNVPMTLAKSKAMNDIDKDFKSASRQGGSLSSTLYGDDVHLSIDSLTLDQTTQQRNEDDEESDDDADNDDDDDSSSADSEEGEESSNEEDDETSSKNTFDVKVFISHLNTTRGFSVKERNGYRTIVRQLSKDYKDHKLALYYLDADGDKIHIAAKTDFEYAIRSSKNARSPKPSTSESENGKSIDRFLLRLTATIVKDSTPLHSPVSRSPLFSAGNDRKGVHTENMSSLGDSEIIWQKGELLGVGSFGRVFSGIDLRSGNKIAVKEIQLSLNHSSSHRTLEQALSIQREVRVLSSLDHANIVKYYGTEYLDDNIRIFLELAPDGSIKDFIHEFGGLAESIIRRYTNDIVSGLVYLHSKGIIHRDIKSSNLLVFNGTIKLADFGCAAISTMDVDSSAFGQSAHGTMAGTTIYMSPEIMQLGNAMSPAKDSKFEFLDEKTIASKRIGYGRKTDIWSLGITLVEMAIGKAPFRNAAAAIYSVCVVKEYPTFPTSMSIEAHQFLSCCLVENPNYRSSSQQLLVHPFLTAAFSSPLPPRWKSSTSQESPSLIYSATTVNSLPDHITKTASTAKAKLRSLSKEEMSHAEEKFARYQREENLMQQAATNEEVIPLHAESDDDMMFFTAVGRHQHHEDNAYYDSKDKVNRSLSGVEYPSDSVSLDSKSIAKSDSGTINTMTGVMTGRSSTLQEIYTRKEEESS